MSPFSLHSLVVFITPISEHFQNADEYVLTMMTRGDQMAGSKSCWGTVPVPDAIAPD